jgi:hypothetical protein
VTLARRTANARKQQFLGGRCRPHGNKYAPWNKHGQLTQDVIISNREVYDGPQIVSSLLAAKKR